MSEEIEENGQEIEIDELEFMELDELFEQDEVKLCSTCHWFQYMDGEQQKECSLIKFINQRAAKKGSNALTDSFSCNRWREIQG